MKSSKLVSIQVLRGLAALMVVFYHAPYGLGHALELPILNGGVDLFFVISGFVMIFSTQGKRHDILAFLRARITRIVPFYWLMTALLLAIWWVLELRDPVWDEILKSLFFIAYLDEVTHLVQPVLLVGWTLNLEMLFYVLFAATLPLNRLVQIAVVTLCFAALVMIRIVAKPASDTVLFFYTTPMLMEFVMGMAIAISLEKLRAMPRFIGAGLILIAVAMALVLGLLFHFPRTLDQGVPSALLLAGCLILEPHFRQRIYGGIKRLGDASYSLYLTHAIIIVLSAPILGQIWWPVGAVLFVALCCVTALMSYTYIEKPLLRLFHASAPSAAKDQTR